MNYRTLGRTGWKVSEISFGAWAIGGSWGEVDDTDSLAALHRAIDCGVNFIDTADVYGMGRSERLIAQLKRDRGQEIVIATKAGRRLSPHTAAGYNEQNLTAFIEDSLRNLDYGLPRPGATALPADRCLLPARGLRRAGPADGGGQDPLLRRERGARGRGAEGDRIPQRADRADHLQLLPPASGGAVLRAGTQAPRSGFWHECRWPAGCLPAS